MPNFPLAFRLLATLALATSLAPAQTYEQVAPKTPATAPAPALPLAEPPGLPPSDGSDDVLVAGLRGLIIAPPGATAVPGEGLQIIGLPLLETPEFRSIAAAYLGQDLTLRGLNRLTRETVLYFRQHGRPVVDVLVPEQKISEGVVRVVVVEGRLGGVRAEGNEWFTTEKIVRSIRAQPDQVIEGGPLLADIAWINQNPFRQVDLVFTRGAAEGQTDLILRTHDRFPLRVYAGYEDTGNALTGYDRFMAGANWGNAFGRDDQMNYQFSVSPDFKTLVAHSGSYVMPFHRSRHTLTVFGSLADSRPVLAGGLFALKGRTWQASARYRVPLASRTAWTRAFTAGVDFKRSNNNLSFGGTQVFAQENDVVQAVSSLSATHPDRHGQISGELTLALSPGGLTSGNHSTAYRAARSFAQPDYAYARLELERVTRLPARFSWVTRATAQLSTANLLGSEQLGLGGATSIRGYEEREANGDNGFVLLNELHAPAMRLGNRLGRTQFVDQFYPLVFFDCGIVSSHRRLTDEPRRLELASAGVGFRYQVRQHLSLRADYGWQLKSSGVSDLRRNQRGHLSAVLSY